ncbi:hypothetical protein EVAR_4847_1 [Eumeta japonica]|uniref:Uncharacterized protein n=1 Tax=Eumeta variegata TaxID=151549 RepID=A0A4C1SZ66_EUMVA|nr:hypothetical protein EVAR_4847_1 [Eumeta japonica]
MCSTAARMCTGTRTTRRCRRCWEARARCAPASPRCRTALAQAWGVAGRGRGARTSADGAPSSRRRELPGFRGSSADRAPRTRCANTPVTRPVRTGMLVTRSEPHPEGGRALADVVSYSGSERSRSESGSDSQRSPERTRGPLHALHALAALKRKRKKFSDSRRTPDRSSSDKKLMKLMQELEKKTPGIINRKGVWGCHRDNARPATSLVTQQIFKEIG